MKQYKLNVRIKEKVKYLKKIKIWPQISDNNNVFSGQYKIKEIHYPGSL